MPSSPVTEVRDPPDAQAMRKGKSQSTMPTPCPMARCCLMTTRRRPLPTRSVLSAGSLSGELHVYACSRTTGTTSAPVNGEKPAVDWILSPYAEKVYPPHTNGKAESIIKTFLAECAYVIAYKTSKDRNFWLPRFLEIYSRHRGDMFLCSLTSL